jgi:hypothetical protein
MMDIYAFDTNMNILGMVDSFDSLIWTRRYFETGNCKLLAPWSEKNIALLTRGNLLMKSDGREAAQISYRGISKEARSSKDQIEITGQFITSWLNRRIILSPVTADDTAQNLMNRIVSENVTDPTLPNRRIPNLFIETVHDVGGDSFQYASEDMINVGVAIEELAKQSRLGFQIITDVRTGNHTFRVYRGADRTYQNTAGNAPTLFATEYDNILSQEFTESVENLCTYAYIKGEKIEGQTPKQVEVGTAQGLDRRELFVNASDLRQSSENAAGQTITMTNPQYLAALEQRGREDLEQHSEALSLSSVINPAPNYKYLTDYDLGDLVTCKNSKWGITIDARITEVEEAYEKGKNGEITITFGESIPTRIGKIFKKR